MNDDLVRSVEGFLGLGEEAPGDNQCAGCRKALDGAPHMEVHAINAWGAYAGSACRVCRVCSWGCLHELGGVMAKRDGQ